MKHRSRYYRWNDRENETLRRYMNDNKPESRKTEVVASVLLILVLAGFALFAIWFFVSMVFS